MESHQKGLSPHGSRALALLTGCATNTMTGRTQMSVISDAEVSQQSLSFGHALAFVNRPNDRLTEHEADRIGIELAARAGDDPAAAVTLWDKMGQLSGKQRAHFLSTHPSSEQRAQTLNDMQAPMRKFQTRALEAQAGQAPGQGHANNNGHGHEHDWLNALKASRPVIDESKAIALYSPRLEDFEMGRIELKGSNTPGVRNEAIGADGDARPGALAGSGVNGDGSGSPLGLELPLPGSGGEGDGV